MSGYAQIKPSGVDDKYVIDLMYMLESSMQGLCTKLDAETAGLNTYLANCYTGSFTVKVFDYRGNQSTGLTIVDYIVNPAGGLSTAALIQWLFEWVNAFETLCEQLDGDGNIQDDDDYEDLCYEAIISPYMFENSKGTIIGQSATSGLITGVDTAGPPWLLTKIGPTAKPNDRVLCDLFYDILSGWSTMAAKLDADAVAAPPTDTDYGALWYEATILMRVENSQGNVLGNAQTRLG